MKLYGMNVLEYIEDLMNHGCTEEQASEIASIEFANAKAIAEMEV